MLTGGGGDMAFVGGKKGGREGGSGGATGIVVPAVALVGSCWRTLHSPTYSDWTLLRI